MIFFFSLHTTLISIFFFHIKRDSAVFFFFFIRLISIKDKSCFSTYRKHRQFVIIIMFNAQRKIIISIFPLTRFFGSHVHCQYLAVPCGGYLYFFFSFFFCRRCFKNIQCYFFCCCCFCFIFI